MFWGLMRVFRKEYITLAFLMAFRVSFFVYVRTTSLQLPRIDVRWIHEPCRRQSPSHVGTGSYVTRFPITSRKFQAPWNRGRGRPNPSLGVDRTSVYRAIPELYDLPMVRTHQLQFHDR